MDMPLKVPGTCEWHTFCPIKLFNTLTSSSCKPVCRPLFPPSSAWTPAVSARVGEHSHVFSCSREKEAGGLPMLSLHCLCCPCPVPSRDVCTFWLPFLPVVYFTPACMSSFISRIRRLPSAVWKA